MITPQIEKIASGKALNVTVTISVFKDIFGVWECRWRACRGERLLKKQTEYFNTQADAEVRVRSLSAILSASQWVSGADSTQASLVFHQRNTDADDEGEESRKCADILEIDILTGALQTRPDVKALVGALGLALRSQTSKRQTSRASQTGLNLSPIETRDEHVRKRSVALFAGLMSEALDGEAIARDIANRAIRAKGDEGGYTRLIPRSQYNYLHYALDDFVHPDRRLGRVALKIMKQGVWTVGDLVRLTEDEVLRLVGGRHDNLQRLKDCLARQGLALNASIPGWRQHDLRRRTHWSGLSGCQS